jgi:hypothetical protein
MGTNFNDMAVEGVNYFESIFKVERQATIAKVLRLSNISQVCQSMEDNQALMEEVGKEELHLILQSFQKIKSRSDGLLVELFLGCYEFMALT